MKGTYKSHQPKVITINILVQFISAYFLFIYGHYYYFLLLCITLLYTFCHENFSKLDCCSASISTFPIKHKEASPPTPWIPQTGGLILVPGDHFQLPQITTVPPILRVHPDCPPLEDFTCMPGSQKPRRQHQCP